ncbi:hypothetical protein IE077_001746 [Cardiosporidium cionae]|uniref:Uncharacterized protein n=1 Tax=Cardiosporidium cionae TaxID=476202 RepID=A0ABQ7JCA4_9APIC|nr:hypothetical protein IE077_001746 [Cardiosporidium cionae]|eukprot:KAF8821663.1 hypothetical protein IE077_001746 [Cardiosporidium cionae]
MLSVYNIIIHLQDKFCKFLSYLDLERPNTYFPPGQDRSIHADGGYETLLKLSNVEFNSVTNTKQRRGIRREYQDSPSCQFFAAYPSSCDPSLPESPCSYCKTKQVSGMYGAATCPGTDSFPPELQGKYRWTLIPMRVEKRHGFLSIFLCKVKPITPADDSYSHLFTSPLYQRVGGAYNAVAFPSSGKNLFTTHPHTQVPFGHRNESLINSEASEAAGFINPLSLAHSRGNLRLYPHQMGVPSAAAAINWHMASLTYFAWHIATMTFLIAIITVLSPV